jgi:hypothetical protein
VPAILLPYSIRLWGIFTKSFGELAEKLGLTGKIAGGAGMLEVQIVLTSGPIGVG